MLTLDEIKTRVRPVAEKYRLRSVDVFGSYARNEATEQSDVDLVVDRSGSTVRGLLDMSALYDDLCKSVGVNVDLVTEQTLDQKSTAERSPEFAETVRRERVRIYARS